MAGGGPQKVRSSRVKVRLPGSGRGSVPVPTAPSLPPAAGPTREEQHVGLKERRRQRRQLREQKARDRAAQREARDNGSG